MNGAYFSAEEFAALAEHSPGPLATSLYFWMRSWMDLATGLVGTNTKISLGKLAAYGERAVPRGSGFELVAPSEKEVRLALEGLVRAGLLVREDTKRLIFLLPLAVLGNARSKRTGHVPGTSYPQYRAGTGHAEMAADAGFSQVTDDEPGTDFLPMGGRTGHTSEVGVNLSLRRKAAAATEVVEVVEVAEVWLLPLRPDAAAGWLRDAERRRGCVAGVSVGDRVLRAWCESGMTGPQLEEAYALAVAARERDNDGRAVNVGFLDCFVRQVLAPKKASARGGKGDRLRPWFLSWPGIEAKAAELGVSRGPDEHPATFKDRVYRAAGVTADELRRAEVDWR